MLKALRDAFRPMEVECPNCRREDFVVAFTGSRFVLASQRIIGRPPLSLLNLRCGNCGATFQKVERGPRRIVGYHGCSHEFAEGIVSGRIPPTRWDYSENEYDWLGRGVYFWEDAPGRAWQWAEQRHRQNSAVVAVELTLGTCVDLGDTEFVPLLRMSYEDIIETYQSSEPPIPLPENEPLPRGNRPVDEDLKLRKLDRLVVDHLVKLLQERNVSVQTVRAPFEEGSSAFPGGKIRTQSHVQISVLDRSCIGRKIWRIPRGAS